MVTHKTMSSHQIKHKIEADPREFQIEAVSKGTINSNKIQALKDRTLSTQASFSPSNPVPSNRIRIVRLSALARSESSSSIKTLLQVPGQEVCKEQLATSMRFKLSSKLSTTIAKGI